MQETELSPEGLNIQKLPIAKSDDFDEPKKKFDGLQPLRTSDELLPMQRSRDVSEIRRSYKQRQRFPQPRYGYPHISMQREYDDYQYYEGEREVGHRSSYRRPYPDYQTSYYRSSEGQDYELPPVQEKTRGESQHRYDYDKRGHLPRMREHKYDIPIPPPLWRRAYSSRTVPGVSRRMLPIADDGGWTEPEELKRPLLDNHMRYKRPSATAPNSFNDLRSQRRLLNSATNTPTLPTLPISDSSPPLPSITPPPQPVLPATSPVPNNLQMTPENCKTAMKFARNWQVNDPRAWIRSNCLLAETFLAPAKCDDIVKFVDSCFRHYFL
ncbi:hypothetical protein FO519_000319 [Halicephalobus sp. NKZ332]|nr:hypothetical protein FO519_000319 [Halicephalobus sp. NKZ332]